MGSNEVVLKTDFSLVASLWDAPGPHVLEQPETISRHKGSQECIELLGEPPQ